MPIICITSSCIKTTYSLDNKYMELSLFAMRYIISWNNASGSSVLAKKLAKNFMTPIAACHFINKMYYNKHLNMSFCLDTFKSHVQNDQWSYYTLQIIMNIYDVLGNDFEKINKLKTNISDKNRLRNMLPKVYRLS